MADETKDKKNWVQTIPGAVGATTALLTATSGLIVALQQANIFKLTPATSNSLPTATSSPNSAQNVTLPISKDSNIIPANEDKSSKGKGRDRQKN